MAINCGISDGRLLHECADRAGVKTVFFFRHSQLEIQKNLAGEITYLGTGTVYRFEQDDTHGLAVQEIIRGDGDTEYMHFQIDMTVFYLQPEFLQTINILKAGSWAIFFLDLNDKIRLMGEQTPMYNLQGVSQSGTTAGDLQYTNLSFQGDGQDYAPFLDDFTEYPFDNFPDLEVVPRYENEPGLILQNNTGDYIELDPLSRLDYN